MSLLMMRKRRRQIAPTSLANLVAWYSARDIATLWQDSGRTTPVVAAADPVGAWDDKSGNARHITQGTAGARPTYRTAGLNNRPSLQFDGGDDLNSAAAWVATTFSGTDLPLMVMAVVYPTTMGANSSIIGLGRAASAVPFRNFRLNTSDIIELAQRNDANTSISNDAAGFAVTSEPHILTVKYTGAVTSIWNEPVPILADEAASTGATTLDTFAVGALVRNTTSLWWTGHIGEVVVATTMTETERKGLQEYLSSAWAI